MSKNVPAFFHSLGVCLRRQECWPCFTLSQQITGKAFLAQKIEQQLLNFELYPIERKINKHQVN